MNKWYLNILLANIGFFVAACGARDGVESNDIDAGDDAHRPIVANECIKDYQCKDDRVCVNGRCVDPSSVVDAREGDDADAIV